MRILKNLYYIFFPLLVGSIVGLIIRNSIDYSNLVKPPLSPPKFLFPIAWSILYLLMGISYFIFRKNDYDKDVSGTYYLQLFFNCLWSIIFFVLKLRFISILWIIFLVILIIRLIKLISPYNKISGYLLIPYLIWCIYATYLNIGIYILN